MNDNYILYSNINKLDLHGFNRYQAKIEIETFILEQYKLGKIYIGIIHGKGEGIVKKATHDTLKNNKYVKAYKVDIFNNGITIVELKSHNQTK